MYGLRVDEKYRVKRTFESLHRFEEGELLIFKGERRFVDPDPCPATVYVPEHEYWIFEVPDTRDEKRLSAFDYEKENGSPAFQRIRIGGYATSKKQRSR
jgi:hypothetical protein